MFYACFAFWDKKSGVTFSDAVNGVFPAIRTTNGKTWENIGARLPAAQAGEAGFAGRSAGWLVGVGGTILKISFREPAAARPWRRTRRG